MIDIPKVMTIAGSDSGGGAGIQADLKTFAAFGVFGTSVITAVTSQNTLGVFDVLEIPAKNVDSQIKAVLKDIGADFVKTGMLSNSEILRIVVKNIKENNIKNLVVDPVMVASSGDRLLNDQAVDDYRKFLIPLSKIITPNIPEAETLSGVKIKNFEDIKINSKILFQMGCEYVLIKGGHLNEEYSIDYLYDGKNLLEFSERRIKTNNIHGTGCTLSSAIAASLSLGLNMEEAVEKSKNYISEALKKSFKVGKGNNPVNHFHSYW
ncbi:MAG TPA: bifunctional hydroxymethylpyrimidine kinase/phosphomethylpyrimidine kinase [Dehalococcoidia bacterium]|jgi:hydroxymethylpyrimidine/phosphomethylpyrimidine kinase|nr:bifunctional hydroxymethylpyrimidine kinase/phosphomethylpyrimidine kinase [Dehalococcoidia bacterium]